MTPPAPHAQRSAFHRLAGNMGKLLSGKAAAGIISLGYIALATRMLGVRDFGVLNLVHGYAVFIGGIIAFSGFHALVRYGAEALAADDRLRLKQLVWFMAIIEWSLALLAMIVAVLLVRFVGTQMQWPPQALQFAPLYSLAILATVRTTPHGLLQLADRFDLIGAHQAIMPMVRLIGAVIVWFVGGGLFALLCVWLTAALAEGLSMWAMAAWVWRGNRMTQREARDDAATAAEAARHGPAPVWQKSVRATRRANPGLLKFAMLSNFDLTLRDFAPRAIPLIIGWVLGPAATGLFVLAQRAAAVLYQPAQMLGQAGYPVITKLIVEGRDRDAAHLVARTLAIAMAAAGVVALILILFGRPLLTLMGGSQFADGAPVLALVAIGYAILAGTPTLSATVTALGKPGASARANLTAGLILLPLLPLLLHMFGTIGAGVHIILQASLLLIMLGVTVWRRWSVHGWRATAPAPRDTPKDTQ